jgi:hypothetical protein
MISNIILFGLIVYLFIGQLACRILIDPDTLVNRPFYDMLDESMRILLLWPLYYNAEKKDDYE